MQKILKGYWTCVPPWKQRYIYSSKLSDFTLYRYSK